MVSFSCPLPTRVRGCWGDSHKGIHWRWTIWNNKGIIKLANCRADFKSTRSCTHCWVDFRPQEFTTWPFPPLYPFSIGCRRSCSTMSTTSLWRLERNPSRWWLMVTQMFSLRMLSGKTSDVSCQFSRTQLVCAATQLPSSSIYCTFNLEVVIYVPASAILVSS